MKNTTINGKKFSFDDDTVLTYNEICNLTHPPYYTVTFGHAPESPLKGGCLQKEGSLTVTEGMVINCVHTGNA